MRREVVSLILRCAFGISCCLTTTLHRGMSLLVGMLTKLAINIPWSFLHAETRGGSQLTALAVSPRFNMEEESFIRHATMQPDCDLIPFRSVLDLDASIPCALDVFVDAPKGLNHDCEARSN